MLISVSSVSGGGKTYSALLLAAGLAGEGRVALLDTENGRGEMYTDSPGIIAALPGGFEYARLDPPFTPARYVEAIDAAEKAGIAVLVVDSTSHEWEGLGGCVDIAENNKLRGMPNWSMAKLAHKRFMNRLLSTNMHLIFCLRARDKVKIVDVEKNGKKSTEVVPIGIQPIAEKSFVFEQLLSLQLDEKTHNALPIKVPEPLAHLFTGQRLLTKADGERIRQWNETGSAEPIRKRARMEAEQGTKSYAAFYASLTPPQKKSLIDSGAHADNKGIAELADKDKRAEELELALSNSRERLGEERYLQILGNNGCVSDEDILQLAPSAIGTVIDELRQAVEDLQRVQV